MYVICNNEHVHDGNVVNPHDCAYIPGLGGATYYNSGLECPIACMDSTTAYNNSGLVPTIIMIPNAATTYILC